MSYNLVIRVIVRNFQDFWSSYCKLILLVIVVTMMFFGPRLLSRYFQVQRIIFLPRHTTAPKMPNPIFSLRVVSMYMMTTLTDFLVFLAAASALLSNCYVANIEAMKELFTIPSAGVQSNINSSRATAPS